MFMIYRVIKILTILWIIVSSLGCGEKPQPTAIPLQPLPFEAAVRLMSENLLDQLEHIGKSQWSLVSQAFDAIIVVDPIINADTGAVTQASRQAQEILEAIAQRKLPKAQIKAMTTESVIQAAYLITGVILTESFENEQRLPHLKASIVDMRSGRIVANASAWIAETGAVDNTPTPMYRDSPMYIKDERVQARTETATATVGEEASKDYFDSLETSALLNEAMDAYDDGNHQLSLALFEKAAARPDGQSMKTYSGLYQNLLKFGQYAEAEAAFAKLTDLGLASGNLSVKFLFGVNETTFQGPPDLLKEFEIWVRQLPRRIMASGQCVNIIGHTSRTGSAEYNRALSLRRAIKIQELMEQQVSGITQRTRTEGRGFDESTSPHEDPLDRRVEFKVTQCS